MILEWRIGSPPEAHLLAHGAIGLARREHVLEDPLLLERRFSCGGQREGFPDASLLAEDGDEPRIHELVDELGSTPNGDADGHVMNDGLEQVAVERHLSE